MLPEVREAMLPYLSDEWGNPSSTYRFGAKLNEHLTTIPNTELNGHKDQRLANTTNITFHGIESEALLLLLDQAGICASSGSACLADSPDPSHVIAAMKPGNAARQSVRFSLGTRLSSADIAHCPHSLRQGVAALSQVVANRDSS